VAGIEPDDHTTGPGVGRGVEQKPCQTMGRPTNGDAIHPIRSGTERTTQTRRAELQTVIEAIAQTGLVGSRQELLDLATIRGVGIDRHPTRHPLEELGVDTHGRRTVSPR
jgi:hypothetical protein